MLQVWGLYLVVPAEGESVFPPGTDKVVHAALFAVPAFLAVVLRSHWALGLLILHALVAEPLQGVLTSTRVPDLLDLVANLVGILCGVLAGRLWRQTVWRQREGSAPRTDMLVR